MPELQTLGGAVRLLDEWIEAHEKLQREHNSLQEKYDALLESYKTRGELLEHFEKLVADLLRD